MTAEVPRAHAERGTQARRADRAPGDAPASLPAQTLRRLQSSAGNRSVTELLRGGAAPRGPVVVSRAGPFVPTFGGAAGVLHLENLNADITLTVPVKNARSAPSGTSFVWSWGVAVADGVERGDIKPATGPAGTFTAKATKPAPPKAKDEMAANVEVTQPGEAAVVHAVEPAMRVAVLEPEYRVEPVVVPGATGGGTVTSLKPSDVLELRVRFDNVDKPRELDRSGQLRAQLAQDGLYLKRLYGVDIPDDQPFQNRPYRWEGDTLVYSVYCHHAGTATYTIDLNVPGAKPHQEKLSLKAEADLDFFLKRCDAASDRHRAVLAAIDAYIQQGFLNYKAGYQAAEAAFKEYADRVQLTRDMLLGILFAGLGGAAGGFAGGLVKYTAEQKWFASIAKKAIGQALIGAVTDAPKDMVKYAARLPSKLGRKGGSGAPPPDDATPGSAPGGGTSKGVPGSVDPLDWYASVQKAARIEEAKVATELGNWKVDAIDAIARGQSVTVDFDPVNAITEVTTMDGTNVAQLGSPPSADAYEKNMWEVWIEHYAYTLRDKAGCYQWGKEVEDNVAKELRAEMDRVEAALAKKGIDAGWVTTALAEARRNAEARAAASPGGWSEF